jgi:hypothetical protein
MDSSHLRAKKVDTIDVWLLAQVYLVQPLACQPPGYGTRTPFSDRARHSSKF